MLQNTQPASISFGARVRKSPFFDSTRNDGAKAFSVYNHMYMPTAYADGTDEYNSLVNDVTMWDLILERRGADDVGGWDYKGRSHQANPDERLVSFWGNETVLPVKDLAFSLE